MVRKSWLLAALAMAGGVAAVAFWPPSAVTVAEVRQGPVVEAIYATGTIRSQQAAQVKSEVAGTVRQRLVEAGERIAAGAPLVILDDREQPLAVTEASAAVDQAEAALRQAESNLALLQRGARPEERDQSAANLKQVEAELQAAVDELRRLETLHAAEAVSTSERDGLRQRVASLRARVQAAQAQDALVRRGNRQEQIAVARAQRDQAKATRDQRRAALARAQAKLADYVVRAPFAGVLASYQVAVGDSVSAGGLLATVVDPARFEVRTTIDEVDLLRVQPGQTALVALDARPERSLPGHVVRIEPLVDPVAKSAVVAVRLQEPEPGLIEGMTATVNIVTARRQGLTVPLAAVGTDAGGAYVWQVDDESRLQRRPVTTGSQDADRIEIRTGTLAAGDRIVAKPDGKLTEGRRVRLRQG